VAELQEQIKKAHTDKLEAYKNMALSIGNRERFDRWALEVQRLDNRAWKLDETLDDIEHEARIAAAQGDK